MKFLLITKEYFPNPDPSGYIVHTLAEELVKNGHSVDIIARDEKNHITECDNKTVYWLKRGRWERLSRKVDSVECNFFDKLVYNIVALLRKFVMLLKIKRFPNVETYLTRRILKLYDEKLSCNKYDAVVGFFRTYSSLESATLIAEKIPGAKCIACYFDMVEDKSCPSFMPLGLYRKLIAKGDFKIFSKSDYVMLPSAANADNPLYKQYGNKVIYYDFPTFITGEDSAAPLRDGSSENTIKLIFAGTLNRQYRNPTRLIDVLNKVAYKEKNKNIQLDIFGGGDCFDLLESFKLCDNFKINIHGMVPKAQVAIYEKNSDFLVNIMNSFKTLVPSKIFGLFASGKPLLNVMTCDDDGSLEYIRKYPAVYTIMQDKDDDALVSEISNFLENYNGYRANIQEIKKIYYKSTPEYFANQVISACDPT